MFFFNFIALVLFIIAYITSNKFGVDWIKIVPGILLLYYLPGHNLNIVLFNKRQFPWYIRLPLDVLTSITFLTIIFLTFKNYVKFFEFRLASLVFLVNLALAIVVSFFDNTAPVFHKIFSAKNKLSTIFSTIDYSFINSKKSLTSFLKDNKIWLIILAIPIVLFIVRLIFNPYIYDIDSLVYFEAYKDIIKTGISNGYPFLGREAFPYFMISSNYVAGLGYIAFFKFFIPLIFYFTSTILFVFTIKSNKSYINYLLYLLILASPMVTIMNEEVRPETFSIAFTIPVLVLSYLGIKNNDKLMIFLAILYASVMLKFHETGVILFLASLATLLVFILQNFKSIYKFVLKNFKLILIIIIPYYLLTTMKFHALSSLLSNGMTSFIIDNIKSKASSIRLDWWFIDNYVAIGGAKISWPGYSAILYYLYNGITLFVLAIYLLIVVLAKNKKIKFSWLPFIPLFVFFFIHFSLAELLPRIGIAIMPNRSWPYIAFSLMILSIILIAKLLTLKISNSLSKIVLISLFICIISGVIGATFGSTFMGAMVLPQEKTSIQALRVLPEDSLIVSTQRNNNLVSIYGNKNFLQIEPSSYESENFDKDVINGISSLVEENKKVIYDSIIIKKTNEDIYYNGINILSRKILSNEKITDNDKKLSLLKEYDQTSYNLTNQKLDKSDSLLRSKNIYFIYSFAKLDHGIINTRQWWRESADVNDYQFFKEYTGQTVAKDKNFILIKVN